jgi:hypothetical protein
LSLADFTFRAIGGHRFLFVGVARYPKTAPRSGRP